MKHLVTLFLVLTLGGCAFADGYQFGDVTKTLISARNVYCSPAVSDDQREAAKSQLASMGIDTGEQSVCAITVEVLVDKAIAQ